MRINGAPPLVVALCVGLIPAQAASSPGRLPDFDASATDPGAARAQHPTFTQDETLLRRGAPIHMAGHLGLPDFIWTAERRTLARNGAPAPADPAQAALRILATYAPFYGLAREDLPMVEARPIHDTGRGGIIARFGARVDGVEVLRDEMKILMGRDGGPIAIAGYLPPGRLLAGVRGRVEPLFRLRAEEAIAAAWRDLTDSEASPLDFRRIGRAGAGGYQRYGPAPGAPEAASLVQPVRIRKVFFHMPESLEPAWHLELSTATPDATVSDHYAYVVSAADGRLLLRRNLTAHAAYTYRVWADPAGLGLPGDGPQGTTASPHPTGLYDGFQAAFVPRALVTLQNGPISTNDPWLPPGAVASVGNNVDAYADIFSPDGLTSRDIRAATSAPGTFDWSYNTSLVPNANQDQIKSAITQIFYDTNMLHDWFYDAGFDEVSGNAQASNLGRGGLENDVLLTEVQDYNGSNNAMMTTFSDGQSPKMEMYIWSGIPDRGMTITAPASIAGAYAIGTGSLGPSTYDLTGTLALVDDGIGSGSDGCTTPFVNQAFVTGKIALIDRGTCTLATKATNAQANGAIGVLIANNDDTGFFKLPGSSTATIPCASISRADGELIRAQLPAGVSARLYQGSAVARDSAIDNTVVAHEWGHYVSNRLVGDTFGLLNNQGSGMGEGWSDFHALLMMVRPEDALAPAGADFSGTYAIASYVTSGGANGPLFNEGYYFGIRRVPYSTDFTKDPLTFRHIAQGEPLPSGVPIAFGSDGSSNAEYHRTGEIWATMLWECYASLLRDTLGPSPRLTFDQARARMVDYLVAGYKMTPLSPTFLEARDALLAAALANDPEDHLLFAQAFARRGAGVGAVAPDRFANDNVGVVESFVLGGEIAFLGAQLNEETPAAACAPDGVMDGGDSGTIEIRLRNTGSTTLQQTTATISSGNPAVHLTSGGAFALPSIAPLETVSASLPVSLDLTPSIETLDFTIQFDDPGLLVPGPRTATVAFRGNYDEAPAQSSTDDAESSGSAWTPDFNPFFSGLELWRRAPEGLMNHVLLGPDPGAISDIYLVSPPLAVASTGVFSFTFRHRYSFDHYGTTIYDGGVLELLSSGGGGWVDIGSAASPGYDQVIEWGGLNPLEGRPAYGALSPGYPAFTSVTVNLGTAYQGQTVQVRFRIGSDFVSGAAGWEIDDVAFSNITNLPFGILVPHDPVCDADDDGHTDATDCAPMDAEAWASPGPARDLLLLGGLSTTLGWSPPADPGGTSPFYDVLRSGNPGNFDAALCLASDQTGTTAFDPAAPGQILYYLVRSENLCGQSLGSSSSGVPRAGRSCP